MSKINKLGQYKGVEIKVTKQTVTQEEIEGGNLLPTQTAISRNAITGI